MSTTLSREQIARYHEDGFVKPVRAFSTQDAAKIRAEIEALERDHASGAGGHTLGQFFRVNGQVTIPLLANIARTIFAPAIAPRLALRVLSAGLCSKGTYDE